MELKLSTTTQGYWELYVNNTVKYPILFTIRIYYEPTGNCQSISIANIWKLLDRCTKEEFLEILKLIYNTICHRLILCDIRTPYKEKLENYFEGSKFLVKQDYTGTYSTGNSMLLYLIDIKPMLVKE